MGTLIVVLVLTLIQVMGVTKRVQETPKTKQNEK